MFCSLPITLPPNWDATVNSVGAFPGRVLDLFVEFRNLTNGLPTPTGADLVGALTYFGLDAMGAAEKKEIQEAIGSGRWEGRFTPEAILDYCQAGTSKRSFACYQSCCPGSIFREHCSGGAT